MPLHEEQPPSLTLPHTKGEGWAGGRHEECGLGGYFSNVFEKDEEMQGIAW
jgi:hypothetical protein